MINKNLGEAITLMNSMEEEEPASLSQMLEDDLNEYHI